jgi:hypothetical protein
MLLLVYEAMLYYLSGNNAFKNKILLEIWEDFILNREKKYHLRVLSSILRH